MTERMNLGKLAGDAYKAMAGLDRFVSASTLPKPLLELVRLRASQINGCVYCVDIAQLRRQAGGGERRAAARRGGVAGGPLLHRPGARGPGLHRGRDPAVRPAT